MKKPVAQKQRNKEAIWKQSVCFENSLCGCYKRTTEDPMLTYAKNEKARSGEKPTLQ